MFVGSDGVFGVGAPEVALIALVGYFVLGPQELYKVTKEVGKFIQSVRTLGTEASKTLEDSMENQLQISELKQAQRELTDAFSFRRSVNVNDYDSAFEERPNPEVGKAVEPEPVEGDKGTVTKKKIRRRVKKKPKVEETAVAEEVSGEVITPNVPDLDMPEEDKSEDQLREERMERLAASMERQKAKEEQKIPDDPPTDWYKASEESMAEEVLKQQQPQMSPEMASEQQSRFASQMRGDWNDKVMANEDKLSPLAMIMDRLAILEEEKQAADARLEEEFRLRGNLEEKFYREQREVLETGAMEVQIGAYDSLSTGETAPDDARAETKVTGEEKEVKTEEVNLSNVTKAETDGDKKVTTEEVPTSNATKAETEVLENGTKVVV